MNGPGVDNPQNSEEEEGVFLAQQAANEADAESLEAVRSGGTATASLVVTGTYKNTYSQSPASQEDSTNATMVIVWAGGWNPWGHVSYTTMQDDTSYSWEGVWNWTIDKPSAQYTNTRSGGELGSEGTGYVLDFGNLNAKFQKALIHAYDSSYGGYGSISDNCGMAFNKAINAIRKDLEKRDKVKLPMSLNIRPSKIREYIENILMQRYVVAQQRFSWHK